MMLGSPENGVDFTVPVPMPTSASVRLKLGMMAKTPIEPVMVEGWAMISSAAVATQ